jgi:putative component of membrane protein insertase Oxa1/YidC/SpoIIIJ protein YidD
MLRPRHLACALIRRYQAGGGGLRYFGIACNFTPTCSEYTRQAIYDQGVVSGSRVGWQRICRCKHKHLDAPIHDPYTPT